MNNPTKMKSLFTATLLFFAAQTFASAYSLPTVDIASIGVSKKVKITINNLKSDATLAITNQAGGTLITESIENGTFGKIYNLELLPDGLYTIGITTTMKEIEQPFRIEQEAIIINTAQKRERLLPFVRLDQKIINVSMLNNRVTDVTVKIKNDAGDILLTENLGYVVKVEKRYNLAALDRGRYQVIIETPDRTYYHDVYND